MQLFTALRWRAGAGDPGHAQGSAGDQVTRISGIVNGTCNYILSRMEAGADYATVLADAQALGYAEANPSADVDGFDARAKLCILSRIALHAELDPDQVATQSISTVEAIDFAYAKELGCTIRQVSRAQLEGKLVHARVAPMLVPLSSPMAWSHGTQNMVVTSGRFGGDVVFSRPRRGRRADGGCGCLGLLAVAQGSLRSSCRCATRGDGRVPGAALSALCRGRPARHRLRRSRARWPRWARTSIRCCSGRAIPSIGCRLWSPRSLASPRPLRRRLRRWRRWTVCWSGRSACRCSREKIRRTNTESR